MNDTTQLEHALRSVADAGGPPDEDAAWTAIRTAVAADDTRRRRRQRATFASTAAVGAAAAALVFVMAQPDADQAVDVGPAGTTATSAPAKEDPGDPSSQVGTPVVLPEDPAVITSNEGKMLNVMDPASGAHVSTPITSLPEDERIFDATITPQGEIFFTLAIPEATVIARTTWDASDTYEIVEYDGPALAEGAGHSDLELDAAGRQLAFVVEGPDGLDPLSWAGHVGILDLDTGVYRQLEWPDGDPRRPYHAPGELSFSPDGTELAFVNGHDTDGTDLYEAYVLDLASAETLADASLVADEVWEVVFGPDGRLHGRRGNDELVVVEGGGRALPPLEGIMELATTNRTLLASTDEDGWFRHVPSADPGDAQATDGWVPTGWDGWHD